MSAEEAVDFCREGREACKPIGSFMGQLKTWEKEVLGDGGVDVRSRRRPQSAAAVGAASAACAVVRPTCGKEGERKGKEAAAEPPSVIGPSIGPIGPIGPVTAAPSDERSSKRRKVTAAPAGGGGETEKVTATVSATARPCIGPSAPPKNYAGRGSAGPPQIGPSMPPAQT